MSRLELFLSLCCRPAAREIARVVVSQLHLLGSKTSRRAYAFLAEVAEPGTAFHAFGLFLGHTDAHRVVPVFAGTIARYHERTLLVEALTNAISFHVWLVERLHAWFSSPCRFFRSIFGDVPVLRRGLIGRTRVRKSWSAVCPSISFEFVFFYRLCAAVFGFAPFVLPAPFLGPPTMRALLSERFEVETFLFD